MIDALRPLRQRPVITGVGAVLAAVVVIVGLGQAGRGPLSSSGGVDKRTVAPPPPGPASNEDASVALPEASSGSNRAGEQALTPATRREADERGIRRNTGTGTAGPAGAIDQDARSRPDGVAPPPARECSVRGSDVKPGGTGSCHFTAVEFGGWSYHTGRFVGGGLGPYMVARVTVVRRGETTTYSTHAGHAPDERCGANAIQPGDWVTVEFYRSGTEVGDLDDVVGAGADWGCGNAGGG